MKVAQCWDDGVLDDIRLMEILRKYGAKASFNLNIGLHRSERYSGWKYQDRKEVWRLSKGELKDAYAGFVVANHSLTHPHLEKIPLDQALRDIRQGRDELEQLFGYPVVGFAYPFGSYNRAVQDAIRDCGHVYARTVANTSKVSPPQDPMAIAPSRHFAAADFWEEFDRVKAADGLFYFWGHSYELVSDEQWQAMDQKIARLSADPAVQWVDLPTLFT